MKRVSRLFAVCVFVVATSFSTSDADAQIRIGSHVGVNFDGTDFMIGLNSHFAINAGSGNFVGNPSLDFYLFEDNVSIYRINLDVLYPFELASATPFVGAGLAIQIAKFDTTIPALGGTTDSDVALNLRAGSFFGDPEASLRPFGDIGLNVGDRNSVTARIGISFGITS